MTVYHINSRYITEYHPYLDAFVVIEEGGDYMSASVATFPVGHVTGAYERAERRNAAMQEARALAQAHAAALNAQAQPKRPTIPTPDFNLVEVLAYRFAGDGYETLIAYDRCWRTCTCHAWNSGRGERHCEHVDNALMRLEAAQMQEVAA